MTYSGVIMNTLQKNIPRRTAITRQASTRTNFTDETLLEGAPPWLIKSIKAWVDELTESRTRDRRTGDRVIGVTTSAIHAVERYLQISLPEDPEDKFELKKQLLDYCNDEIHCLDVAVAFMAIGDPHMAYTFDESFVSLNLILKESGSKWIAVPGGQHTATFEERVNETAQEAYAATVSEATNLSGDFLKRAWSAGFGRNPNPSEAYNNAIKAMEAAAWPIVTPQNNSATLGHIIGELKANPGKWQSALREAEVNLGVGVIRQSMQVVWEGHSDRHGTGTPQDISQEAAEQSIFTAVTVCVHFNRGYIKLR